VLYLPVKSSLNSVNPSGFNTYKIRENNPLYFQHLRNFSHLFILKALQLPLESTLTSPLSLTPVESTLTKNRGWRRGVIMVNQSFGPASSRTRPGSLATLPFTPRASDEGHSCLALRLSLQRAKCISHVSNRLRTLCEKHRGVPQLLFTPKALSEGPLWNCIRAISRANHSMVNSDPQQLKTEN